MGKCASDDKVEDCLNPCPPAPTPSPPAPTDDTTKDDDKPTFVCTQKDVSFDSDEKMDTCVGPSKKGCHAKKIKTCGASATCYASEKIGTCVGSYCCARDKISECS